MLRLCKLLLSTLLICTFGIGAHEVFAAGKDPVDYVDPMIGTSTSRWMLYPGPSMPFGMVKLSPDNQEQKWKAGYEYTVENIAGFSHIHSWVMGGLLMMPTVGTLQVEPGTEKDPDSGYRSRFRHETEVASPGYYAVTLDDYGITAELTATTRTGFQRYRFPEAPDSRVLIDLQTPIEYGYELDWAWVRKVNDREIEGFAKQHSQDKFSTLFNEYTIHFVIQFNKPFESMGGWFEEDIQQDIGEISGWGNVGCFVNYATAERETIEVKSGISLVSIEQARLNLETENPGWDFEGIRQAARKTWNDLLGRILVEGGSETDKVKFYTNFYRSFAARTIWSDVNGKYVDMCEQVRQVKDPGNVMLGCDAFWNTFWNLNQLWELVTPEIANQWVASLLQFYEDGGWLPKGPTGLEYSGIMVASHEVALINSAYQKGIRNYDVEKAYEAIRHVQMTPGRPHPCGGSVGNRQLKPYMELGYVPHGKEVLKYRLGTPDIGPVSNTLEYAFDDWNVAQMAKGLGKEADFEYFTKRAYNYRNVFHADSGYVRPRLRDGTWVLPGDLSLVKKGTTWHGTGFVEGSSWQYTWFVPHDVQGLINLIGKDEFNGRLEKGFVTSSKTNFNATADRFNDFPINHGNQPNMQAAYLFNYSGQPWKTQYWVREILDKYYGDDPVDGWPGDEDQGQMGAWFVMSAVGLFEMDGGGAMKPVYEIGSPLFEKIFLQLDSRYYPGRSFVIEARNGSQSNRYIQSAELNGKPLNRPWFYHSELIKGGRLVLEMGASPNQSWGSRDEDAPPSMSSPK